LPPTVQYRYAIDTVLVLLYNTYLLSTGKFDNFRYEKLTYPGIGSAIVTTGAVHIDDDPTVLVSLKALLVTLTAVLVALTVVFVALIFVLVPLKVVL
jgi:hypothetical protein